MTGQMVWLVAVACLSALQQQHVLAMPGAACSCVPYYQCDVSNIASVTQDGGQTNIDIRSGASLSTADFSHQTGDIAACPALLDVCCSSPNTGVIPVQGPAQQHQAKCGKRNPTGTSVRVSGITASQSQFGEFPWMAAILQTEFVGTEEVNLYVCGGSLIYPDVVLTAAHCVHSWQHNPSVLKVRLGEWDTQRTYELYTHQERRVSQVISHEHFNAKNLHNDFALLLLESPIELAPHIDTICLPDQFPNIEHSRCYVTGWGKEHFGKHGVFQNILKKVTLPMVERHQCESALRSTRLGRYFNLHSTFNCAGGGSDGQDACKGDGGSPLVCPLRNDPSTYVQMGIVAWGIGCGEPGIPGVYADVTQGLQWINQKLNRRF